MFDLHVHALDRAVITIRKGDLLDLDERERVVVQVREWVDGEVVQLTRFKGRLTKELP